MSNKNDIYTKLKELFNLTKVSEKFEDVTLKDGSCLRGDLIPGAKLQLVSVDGTVSDAADGEYELSDGRKLSIKSGVVDSISDAQVATTAPDTSVPDATVPVVTPTDEPMATDIPVTDPSTTDGASDAPHDEEIESMLPQIVADLATRVGALEKALGDAKAQNMEMATQLAKFSKEPAATTIKRTQAEESFSSAEVNENKFFNNFFSYRKI